MSVAFRRQNPFCRFCDQEGRVGLAEIMDHIKPREEFPELAYVWKNCQSLCRHHDGVKQRMEILARKTGQLEMLPVWCSSLESRPRQVTAGP